MLDIEKRIIRYIPSEIVRTTIFDDKWSFTKKEYYTMLYQLTPVIGYEKMYGLLAEYIIELGEMGYTKTELYSGMCKTLSNVSNALKSFGHTNRMYLVSAYMCRPYKQLVDNRLFDSFRAARTYSKLYANDHKDILDYFEISVMPIYSYSNLLAMNGNLITNINREMDDSVYGTIRLSSDGSKIISMILDNQSNFAITSMQQPKYPCPFKNGDYIKTVPEICDRNLYIYDTRYNENPDSGMINLYTLSDNGIHDQENIYANDKYYSGISYPTIYLKKAIYKTDSSTEVYVDADIDNIDLRTNMVFRNFMHSII